MKQLYWLLCLVFAFAACEKPPVREEPPLPPAQAGGIFILNEGTFNAGTASLGFYDFKEKTLTDDVFKPANNRPLGDVLQSMTLRDGTAYLVVNNSKKIEMIDVTSFQSEGTITGFNSPRYMLFIDNSKAYVSDLYDNAIAVVSMSSKSIVKKIPCPGATEQMLLYNNKVYVCNTLQRSLYIVDVNTDELIDSIPLSYGPNSIVMDHNNKIWVLCSGSESQSIYAGLHRINPANDSVELSIVNIYPQGIFGANRMVINGTGDHLYWLNKDVQDMSIAAQAPPAEPFIRAVNNKFYGIGTDPFSGEIYISDAIDYVQRSSVYHYTPDGSLIGVFKTGVSTNGFYFYYK